MKREFLIQKTLKNLSKLPDDKVVEVSLFAEFLLKVKDENDLADDIKILNKESKSLDYLEHEEDLYTVNDLKEHYK